MNNWIQQVVDDYYSFLKGKTTIVTETGTNWSVISTPFMGLFNDTIDLYARKEKEKIILSDDGETLRNLDLAGSTISRSPKRKEILEKILLNYGVTFIDDELQVEATANNFPQKKYNLISAISEVSDMYTLAKHTVASIFKEDVRNYLDEQQIIYTPQFISKGSTGLEFTFDFQIAYRNKEIVIKSFNNINKLNLPNFLFTWDDIKSVRERVSQKEVIGLAIINDEDKEIKDEYIEALENKNTQYILWKKRHESSEIQKIKVAA
jgi:hypothetical protein